MTSDAPPARASRPASPATRLRRAVSSLRHIGWLLGLLALLASPRAEASAGSGDEEAAQAPAPGASSWIQTVPGTTATIEMVPVSIAPEEPPSAPAGDDGVAEAEAREPLRPGTLFVATTEVTWDVFDVFLYRLDRREAPADPAVDGVARPTEPYVMVDRGYGHAGHPALSMSHRGAEAFCAWLSARTGKRWRLPSEREFERLCTRGGHATRDARQLDEVAWTKGNAGRRTHPVGSREADALGLHDLLGNVAEWCNGPDGPVLRGGSFLDRRSEVGCASRRLDDPLWNASDPNIPKSPWWLADAPFVGMRVVCEDGPDVGTGARPIDGTDAGGRR